jgi:SOS response regulatory protein OraA/RecX
VARRQPVEIPDDPQEAFSAAYTRGLRLLGARERSESDVRTRLTELGFPADIVDAAVARLLASGAINESRAARAVARTLVQVRRRGRLRAVRELQAKGFPESLASEAVGELIGADDERTAVERALDRKLRGRAVVAGDTGAMRRLMATLVRQGHPPGIVRTVIRDRFRNATRLTDEDGDM